MKIENSKRLIKRTFMDVTRHIRRNVERELWARAAGRCQFSGCNRILYKSPVTQERVNISEKAHIYSFSCRGPRGRGTFNKNVRLLNEVGNLMLVCHDCHKKMDQEQDGGRYSADLLRQWKILHEKRVAIVTGVDPNKKSTVVLYGANIGDEKSPLRPLQAHWAMFPHAYPSEENPISLSMTWEGKDDDPDYWVTEGLNLEKGFERWIRPRIAERDHFSIFAFAPMPLLIRLGALFTDKIAADVYQLRREPEQSWQWSEESHDAEYRLKVPHSFEHPPALIVSLSAPIAHHRVTSVLGRQIAIWEITIDKPNNDFLRTREQLSRFRQAVRRLMVRISDKHGNDAPLAIFPAMPVAAAVELGRVRMPKAEMLWIIYDHNNKTRAFVKALEI
ncbi:MAG: HNH endonuclease [Nitrospira sp.]|nr:MAG: HNH endonuclease [Nitrospira sp.]